MFSMSRLSRSALHCAILPNLSDNVSRVVATMGDVDDVSLSSEPDDSPGDPVLFFVRSFLILVNSTWKNRLDPTFRQRFNTYWFRSFFLGFPDRLRRRLHSLHVDHLARPPPRPRGRRLPPRVRRPVRRARLLWLACGGRRHRPRHPAGRRRRRRRRPRTDS